MIDLVTQLVQRGANADSPSRFDIAKAIHALLSPSQREQLSQLVKSGPVWDGNVVSKRSRDDLLDMGLAVRVCCKGEQGYTAAKYYGATVLKVSVSNAASVLGYPADQPGESP